MSEQFLGEVRIFALNFPPSGWAFCNGQLMPISQNTALFALLGTFYGGDGKSTFALPDFQRSAPMHQDGDGSQGLSARTIGETGGAEFVTLLDSEMPVHTHSVMATNSPALSPSAQSTDPSITFDMARTVGQSGYGPAGNLNVMAPQMIAPTGGGLPHNNLMPYLALNFCIALQGVFPPRD